MQGQVKTGFPCIMTTVNVRAGVALRAEQGEGRVKVVGHGREVEGPLRSPPFIHPLNKY